MAKAQRIVMKDADLDLAAYGITFGGLFNSGQACESGTRILVHEAIHDQLMEKLAAVCDTLVVGNPLDPKQHLMARLPIKINTTASWGILTEPSNKV
ncbi:aldehyde dehydrogenase family protein [Colwellia maritima]|uniref:aldehyde dehydrogenase family protein n=1 Tax=Colwellia maritima TaxID=2912588 RepID=UPI003083FB1A